MRLHSEITLNFNGNDFVWLQRPYRQTGENRIQKQNQKLKWTHHCRCTRFRTHFGWAGTILKHRVSAFIVHISTMNIYAMPEVMKNSDNNSNINNQEKYSSNILVSVFFHIRNRMMMENISRVCMMEERKIGITKREYLKTILPNFFFYSSFPLM